MGEVLRCLCSLAGRMVTLYVLRKLGSVVGMGAQAMIVPVVGGGFAGGTLLDNAGKVADVE